MPELTIGSEIIGAIRREPPLDLMRFQDTAAIVPVSGRPAMEEWLEIFNAGLTELSMTDPISRIAKLNDRVRLRLDRNARIVITATCLATLAGDDRIVSETLAQTKVLGAIRRYVFTSEDGPERACGEFAVGETTVRFRIDYYDPSLEWGSEDPADAAATTRVMTIMLPGDD